MLECMAVYCKQCRYNLKGLPAGECPECGRAFDPADSATFWDGKLPIARWFWTWAIIFSLAVLLGGVLLTMANETLRHGEILEIGAPAVMWSTGYRPGVNGGRPIWHGDGIVLNSLISMGFGLSAGWILVYVRKRVSLRPPRD